LTAENRVKLEAQMENHGTAEHFGCDCCCPADAEAAWTARDSLKRVSELIDESHCHVMILACGACSQRFISVFTETIDWADGEDPQYWTLLPITGEEAADISMLPAESKLNSLGPGRRCLRHDHPKGEEASIFWGTGIWVGPHD